MLAHSAQKSVDTEDIKDVEELEDIEQSGSSSKITVGPKRFADNLAPFDFAPEV